MTNQRDAQPKGGATYQAYLIRLWQDGRQNGWRASAQSVHSGETTRFGSLEALFAFLLEQTRDQAE